MNDNRRRTCVNAIHRASQFVTSYIFQLADIWALRTKKEALENAFKEFVDEHQRYVSMVPRELFNANDVFFSEIEEIYQRAIYNDEKFAPNKRI